MKVAPFTGAWIEITSTARRCTVQPVSHPSRVRGLKYRLWNSSSTEKGRVAPFTGAWIEM